MKDRQFLRLSDKWALAYDKNQWIMRKRARSHNQTVWSPVAFIGSTKTLLRRVMAENGVLAVNRRGILTP